MQLYCRTQRLNRSAIIQTAIAIIKNPIKKNKLKPYKGLKKNMYNTIATPTMNKMKANIKAFDILLRPLYLLFESLFLKISIWKKLS